MGLPVGTGRRLPVPLLVRSCAVISITMASAITIAITIATASMLLAVRAAGMKARVAVAKVRMA